MTFNSHPVVKEYLGELKKITAVKEQIRGQLIKALENLAETRTDDGPNEEYQRANQRVKELELELSTITSKGQRYMYKIDQLNGVRQ
jgi:vacuolar-type H+-ATPase subunit I/STV1